MPIHASLGIIVVGIGDLFYAQVCSLKQSNRRRRRQRPPRQTGDHHGSGWRQDRVSRLQLPGPPNLAMTRSIQDCVYHWQNRRVCLRPREFTRQGRDHLLSQRGHASFGREAARRVSCCKLPLDLGEKGVYSSYTPFGRLSRWYANRRHVPPSGYSRSGS